MDSEIVYAVVEEVIGKTGKYSNSGAPNPRAKGKHSSDVWVYFFIFVGSRGGITQVKVKFQGSVERTLVRNVKGPVRKGDTLALLESEREARRLRWARGFGSCNKFMLIQSRFDNDKLAIDLVTVFSMNALIKVLVSPLAIK